MLKYLTLILTFAFLINVAKGRDKDTTIVYFQNDLNGYHKVTTLDSADFFRIILPPDSGDTKYNIREYYKNGKIKLVGKSDPLHEKFKKGLISFCGDCVTYYHNGKRESISQYFKNSKEGFEYIYYPNGSIYFTIKHTLSHKDPNDEVQYWECYDKNGTKTCTEGNGDWITYDKEYKQVLVTGKVKNGYKEGEWDGKVLNADSIRYVYNYAKGVITSSVGYDKAGAAFPFIFIRVAANYKGGFNTFIDELKSHLKVPKGPDGKKIVLDNIKIVFIVEKDGTTSNFEILGIVNTDLNKALVEALSKCYDWTPTRFYGIPYKTRVTLPLKYFSKSVANGMGVYYNIPFDEEILGF